jgi:hypothetical protein
MSKHTAVLIAGSPDSAVTIVSIVTSVLEHTENVDQNRA